MTDYYDLAVSETYLPCTEERYKWLEMLLQPAVEADDDPDYEHQHGFELKFWSAAGVLLVHEDMGSCYPQKLPPAFLAGVATLLQELGAGTWDVGVAQLASRSVEAGYSGYNFRITNTGHLEQQAPGPWKPWPTDLPDVSQPSADGQAAE